MGRSKQMPSPAGMQKIEWVIPPADERTEQLAKSLKISPLIAQILVNRGIVEAREGTVFLQPKLTELIRPAQMPGIAPAVARLTQAIEKKEKITIYGDYDVDGITGVSILWELLTLLGAQVDYYIPHRIDEGYGLNSEAVRALAEAGTRLLITVDCGISAIAAAELAKQLGMDLIVTDHHQPGAALPSAVAIVHPALEPSYREPGFGRGARGVQAGLGGRGGVQPGAEAGAEAPRVHAQRHDPGGHRNRRGRRRSAGRESRADAIRACSRWPTASCAV